MSSNKNQVRKTILVTLTRDGNILANRLKAACPDFSIHGLEGRSDGAEVTFSQTTKHLQKLFHEGHAIVGLCASGILVRALGPILTDKTSEPPVIAVSSDGAHVVPLLGGHHGGIALAKKIAGITHGTTAVTTASEVQLGLALDDPPRGWRIENVENVKPVTAALLAGEPVSLILESDDGGWLSKSDIPFAKDALWSIRVTAKASNSNAAPPPNELILHPPVLVVGVGCERGAEYEELSALLAATLNDKGLSAKAVACIASIDLKADEVAVHALARELDVPARFFSPEQLESQAPRLANPSNVVFEETGCHGVSEGAALTGGGAASELVAPKVKSKRTTCAITQSPVPLDPFKTGRARGHLSIVGIGPGSDDWMTPEALTHLKAASDLVAYGLYLDLVGKHIEGKKRHDHPLGAEEERVRHALNLAAEGKNVALVSSGDAGIYAMASLAFELLHEENRDDWNRISISVAPGISALQAAASRIGAPLGHDFCTISLSDLLTPREDILKRIKAAGEGDFIIAFYNPVSKRRKDLLPMARDILLEYRDPRTPVVLARNLGREEETIITTTLKDLHVDQVDMLTLVLIGNTHTKQTKRGEATWVYTPRGYAAKRGPTQTDSLTKKAETA